MMKTRVRSYFSFITNDDFPLHEVTNLMNLEPTKTTKLGVPMPNNPSRNHLYTRWDFGTEYIETLDVNEVLMPIIQTLERKVKEILDLKKLYKLDTTLSIVIEIHGGHAPGLVINTRVSKLATDIGADFDIDLYAYPYTDDE